MTPGRRRTCGRRCSSDRHDSWAGDLLEVMVEVIPPRDLHIFHVMAARPKHMERMKEDR